MSSSEDPDWFQKQNLNYEIFLGPRRHDVSLPNSLAHEWGGFARQEKERHQLEGLLGPNLQWNPDRGLVHQILNLVLGSLKNMHVSFVKNMCPPGFSCSVDVSTSFQPHPQRVNVSKRKQMRGTSYLPLGLWISFLAQPPPSQISSDAWRWRESPDGSLQTVTPAHPHTHNNSGVMVSREKPSSLTNFTTLDIASLAGAFTCRPRYLVSKYFNENHNFTLLKQQKFCGIIYILTPSYKIHTKQTFLTIDWKISLQFFVFMFH